MAPGDRGEQSSPCRATAAFAEWRHVRQVAVGVLPEPPVTQPFAIVSIGAEAGHEPFGRHLAIPVAHALAVRTIHVVAAEIQTPLGPLVDAVYAVEQIVRALKGSDLFQITLDQQCRRVFLRGSRRQTVDHHVAETGVIELVLEHLTGFAGRDELADLVEMLIALPLAAHRQRSSLRLPPVGAPASSA